MNRSLILALAASTLLGGAARAAAPALQRVRGTIVAASATGLTIHPAEGADIEVKLDAGVKYAGVVASQVGAIRPGSFIGTATKGFGSHMTALEVVVFPPELRGQGEGHYPWDKLPDTGGGAVASSMTNGTVEAGHAPQVGSSMTNGTIGTATSDAGGLHIAVAYKGGHKDIVVPASAPVVAFKVAGPGVVKKGAQAFIVAATQNGDIEAKFVAVGQDGVRPPM
jgi:hypothetical protein